MWAGNKPNLLRLFRVRFFVGHDALTCTYRDTKDFEMETGVEIRADKARAKYNMAAVWDSAVGSSPRDSYDQQKDIKSQRYRSILNFDDAFIHLNSDEPLTHPMWFWTLPSAQLYFVPVRKSTIISRACGLNSIKRSCALQTLGTDFKAISKPHLTFRSEATTLAFC